MTDSLQVNKECDLETHTFSPGPQAAPALFPWQPRPGLMLGPWDGPWLVQGEDAWDGGRRGAEHFLLISSLFNLFIYLSPSHFRKESILQETALQIPFLRTKTSHPWLDPFPENGSRMPEQAGVLNRDPGFWEQWCYCVTLGKLLNLFEALFLCI